MFLRGAGICRSRAFFMILEGWQDPAPFRPAISCAHRRYKYTFSAILKIYFCKSLKIFPDIIENQSRICYHQTEGWVRHGVGRPGIEHENKGAELRSVSGFFTAHNRGGCMGLFGKNERNNRRIVKAFKLGMDMHGRLVATESRRIKGMLTAAAEESALG